MEDDPKLIAMLEAGRYEQERFHELRSVTPTELRIAAALGAQQPTLVKAGASATLLDRGFRAGECHRNCMAAAEAGQGEHVFGWTSSGDRFLSHSVLRLADGSLHCITPEHTDELDEEGRFPFIEDASVTCDGERMFWRGEWLHPFNTIIRREPEAVRARYEAMLGRLRRGELSYQEAVARDATS